MKKIIQADIAKMCGCDRTYINKIIKGYRRKYDKQPKMFDYEKCIRLLKKHGFIEEE